MGQIICRKQNRFKLIFVFVSGKSSKAKEFKYYLRILLIALIHIYLDRSISMYLNVSTGFLSFLRLNVTLQNEYTEFSYRTYMSGYQDYTSKNLIWYKKINCCHDVKWFFPIGQTFSFTASYNHLYANQHLNGIGVLLTKR